MPDREHPKGPNNIDPNLPAPTVGTSVRRTKEPVDPNLPARTVGTSVGHTGNLATSEEKGEPFDWSNLGTYLQNASNPNNGRQQGGQQSQNEGATLEDKLEKSYAFFRKNAATNPYLTGFSVIDDYKIIPADALLYSLLNVYSAYTQELAASGGVLDPDTKHFYEETAYNLLFTAQGHKTLEERIATPYSPKSELNRNAAYILMVAHSGDPDLDYFVKINSMRDLKNLPFANLASFEEKLREGVRERRASGTVLQGSIEYVHDRNKLAYIKAITDAADRNQVGQLKRLNPELDPESPVRDEYAYLRKEIETDPDLAAFAYINDFTLIPSMALKVFNRSLNQQIAKRNGGTLSEGDSKKLAALKKIERYHAAIEKTAKPERDPERQYKKDCAFLRLCANAGDQDLRHSALTGMGLRIVDPSLAYLRRKTGVIKRNPKDEIKVPGLYDLSAVKADEFTSMAQYIQQSIQHRQRAGDYSGRNDLYDYDCAKVSCLTQIAAMNAYKAQMQADENTDEEPGNPFTKMLRKFWGNHPFLVVTAAVLTLAVTGSYLQKYNPRTIRLKEEAKHRKALYEKGVEQIRIDGENSQGIRRITEKKIKEFFKSPDFNAAQMESCAAKHEKSPYKNWSPEVLYQMNIPDNESPYCSQTTSTISMTGYSGTSSQTPIHIGFYIKKASELATKAYNMELGQRDDPSKPYYQVRFIAVVPGDPQDKGGKLSPAERATAETKRSLYKSEQRAILVREGDTHQFWENRQLYKLDNH